MKLRIKRKIRTQFATETVNLEDIVSIKKRLDWRNAAGKAFDTYCNVAEGG